MKLTLKKKTYSFRNHIKANINTFQSLNPKKINMLFENTDKDAAFHWPAARSQSNI